MKTLILVIPFILCCLFGCKKLIDVSTPQNQLTTDKVFSDTTSATAALSNIYALFDKTIDPNYNKFMGLYTDEFNYPTAPTNDFALGNLIPTDANITNIWKNNYFAIYSCNDLITQLQTSNLSSGFKATSIAEAKFLRAFAYFYLVNSFSQIPLVLTTNVNQNATARQTDSLTVYKQIIADLTDAKNNLPATYIGGEKVRANKWAAAAMLARVYLYQRDWQNSLLNANLVLNSAQYNLTNSPSDAFKANSTEVILQFWTQNGYIADAPTLIPGSGSPLYPVTPSLLNAFEAGDIRKTDWLNSKVVNGTTLYYAFKYKNRTTNSSSPEYLAAFRLAEQFLIIAECKANQGDLAGATTAVNIIRTRAGLAPIPVQTSLNSATNAILQEYRVEFFAEWGHRYLDLKRTGRLNGVMTSYKPGWSGKSDLLPIPQNELIYDPTLTQNPGY